MFYQQALFSGGFFFAPGVFAYMQNVLYSATLCKTAKIN